MADPRFKTGARPTPRHKLLAATPHVVVAAPPPQAAYVPARLSMWGNDVHGDCVTAEEAFAKACYSPEIFVPEDQAIAWATRHGVLEGADLLSVMQAMQRDGFTQGSQIYDDGPPSGVDYTNELVLQSAISQGPVKIGISHDCLPSTAGNRQGWYAVGPGHNVQMDHCVSLCGYGSAQWLYGQLGVALPAALHPDQQGYLLFTWSTLGFVDHPWIVSACGEAWLRNPTTVGVPPLTPGPAPGPSPLPPPPGPAMINVMHWPRLVKGQRFAGRASSPVPEGDYGLVPATAGAAVVGRVTVEAPKKRGRA